MQLIFKYDIDRLMSYASDCKNNIHIAEKNSFMMLAFPEVDYFNYAFTPVDQILSGDKLTDIERHYLAKDIIKHKIVVNANCAESNELLNRHSAYNYTSTIAKTAIAPAHTQQADHQRELDFVNVDESNIDMFARLYLKSFESDKQADNRIVNNFKSLLNLKDLDLFMLKKEDKYVGVNVLYQSEAESLLAGGAILPEHRNQGFHLQSLKFRIDKAVNKDQSKNIVAWAYNPSVSLKNMLKLKMKVQENFNVYEYCR
jgi:hypothetical protein